MIASFPFPLIEAFVVTRQIILVRRLNTRGYNKEAISHDSQGLIYKNTGRYDEAIAEFNKAIEIDPENADNYYNHRGNSYYGKGEYEKAISDYEKSIKINPMPGKYYYNSGIAYCAMEEYDKAIKHTKKAVKLDPKNSDVYYNLGLYYEKKKNMIFAVYWYIRAINQNKLHANAYNNRGNIWLDIGLNKWAKADFDRALKADPSYYLAHYNQKPDLHKVRHCPYHNLVSSQKYFAK